MRFVATKEFPGRYGRQKAGSYEIPAQISLGDAKALRADGYGDIERVNVQTPGGAATAAAPFPPGYEHKEEPAASPVPAAPRRGRPRKS